MTNESLERGYEIKTEIKQINDGLNRLKKMEEPGHESYLIHIQHPYAGGVDIPRTHRTTFIALLRSELTQRKEALEKEFASL